jgi:CBS domain-containing protein
MATPPMAIDAPAGTALADLASMERTRMTTPTTIADVMTPDPQTVQPGDSVQHAARLMDELNVGALPVCEGTQLVGIVTDRDITVRATAIGLVPASTEVERVMTEHVRCCSEQQSPREVLEQMARTQIRRMLVVDDAQRLVGVVSLGDLASHRHDEVEETLRRISTPCAPDRETAIAA